MPSGRSSSEGKERRCKLRNEPKNMNSATCSYWRHQRGKSQLDLSLDTGISQRHLSLVERCRSVPSRGLLRIVSEALDIPLQRAGCLPVRFALRRSVQYASAWPGPGGAINIDWACHVPSSTATSVGVATSTNHPYASRNPTLLKAATRNGKAALPLPSAAKTTIKARSKFLVLKVRETAKDAASAKVTIINW